MSKKRKELKVSENTVDDLLDTASLILGTASNALAFAPVPHLADAVSSLNDLIGRVKSMRLNKKRAKDVADRIETLVRCLQEIANGAESELRHAGITNSGSQPQVSPHVTNMMEALNKKLNDLNQVAKGLEGNSFVLGFIRSDHNAETLKDLKEGLDNAIEDCRLEGQIYMEIVVENMGRDLSLLRNVAVTENDMKTLESIPHAPDASYRSALNELKSGLLPGTRTGILQDIERWARAPLDSDEPPIFVLTGGAGTGKSTIASEVAKRLEKDKLLGASFFFVRGSEDLATTRLVFSTIAYQLAQNHPEFFPHIVEAARGYLRGGQLQQMEFTLKELILQPLMKGFENHDPVVIIIDAVDECTEAAQDLVPRMLHLLAQYLPDVPFPLRVLITSRPEYHVEDALESLSFRNGSRRFKLQDILPTVADGDIKQYLNARISDLPKSEEVFSYRDDVVDALTIKAEGLFIYASTITKLLRQDREHIFEILSALLTGDPIHRRRDLGEMDHLYLIVLHNALDGYLGNPPDDECMDAMRKVLASIALLQDQLSPTALCDLLKFPVNDIRSIVNRMGAVIFLGKDNGPIRPLHASFPQFLVDPRRCSSPEFHIDPPDNHACFAAACLDTLNHELCRNICHLQNPATFKKDVEDLQTRVDRYLPSHVQYACVHWATHLSNVDTPSAELLKHLSIFTSKCLLLWFEAVSFMRRLDGAPRALLIIRDWCQKKPMHDDDTQRLIHDGHRFVLEYFDPINECPEHIYISALPTAPCCRLVNIYGDSASVRMLSPRDPQWGPRERIIEVGKRDAVRALTYSPNGLWIVAGMHSGRIQSWDAVSGVTLNVMTGHTRDVYLIGVSPDNSCIISCADIEGSPQCLDQPTPSHAKDLRIWHLVTGGLLYTFPVDPAIITFRALGFSSDSDVIMAVVYSRVADHCGGSQRNDQMRMWDARTYKPVEVAANSRQNFGRVVGDFPYRENSFVTWVDDDIHVLDYESGLLRKTLQKPNTIQRTWIWESHPVFFPEGTSRVLSYNGIDIVIWDVESEQHLYVLKQANPTCVAISPRGDMIASGSDDDYQYTVTIWNAETGDPIAVLSGHTQQLISVCFAPDGARLVSGDRGGIIRVWDLSNPVMAAQNRETLALVHSGIVISDSGNFVAMAEECQLRIWSTAVVDSGQPVVQCIPVGDLFPGGSTLLLSPDDAWVVVNDRLTGHLEMFDVRTGQSVMRATGPPHEEPSPRQLGIYSPDGNRFATVDLQLVHIWRASGLRLEWTFRAKDYVNQVEFSPDSTRICARNAKGSIDLWNCSTGQALSDTEMDWTLKTARPKLKERDGWICDQSGRKICWLTQSRRPSPYTNALSMSPSGGHLAIISFMVQLTTLDISKCQPV